jgi:protein TonB
MRKTNFTRLILFLTVAAAHLLLILFFAITVDAGIQTAEQPPSVMKLTDLEEEAPPPPPPEIPPPEVPQTAVESIAETMIETEEVPEDQVVVAPGTLIAPPAPVQAAEDERSLPMHLVSVPPVFSEREVLASLVYPPIALRAGIVGTVYLELFIDRQGEIRQITVLRETPPDRGFGEAAVNAFRGLRAKPAEANGEAVAVRYRYPVRFTIRN